MRATPPVWGGRDILSDYKDAPINASFTR